MKSKYCYIITACAFLIMFINVGFPSTSFGVYQPYIVNQPNMSHFYGTLVVSLRSLSSLITMFFVASWYKKFNCRIGISFATIFTGLGFIIFGLADNVYVYCFGSIVVGIGYSLGGASGMTLLLDNWYGNKASVHLGIATAGSSFSGIILPSIVLFMLSVFNLGYSFFVQGLAAIMLAIVLFVLIKNTPNYSVKSSKASVCRDEKTFHSVLSVKKYWLFVFAIVVLGGVCIVGINFLSILFSTAGSSPEAAANVVICSGIALFVSKLITGYSYDKLGSFKATILFFIIMFVGVILLCITPGHSDIIIYISTCIFVFGCSIATVGISRWSIELSVPGYRERTVRDFQAAYTCGGFLVGLIPGTIAQFCGSYVPFYILAIIMCLAFGIIFIAIYPKGLKS